MEIYIALYFVMVLVTGAVLLKGAEEIDVPRDHLMLLVPTMAMLWPLTLLSAAIIDE